MKRVSSVGEFKNSTFKKLDAILRKSTFEMNTRIVQRTPRDTGRAAGGWIPEFYGLRDGLIARIHNNVHYIKYLEFGHSKQAPSGMVRVTLAEFQQILNNALSTE